MIRVILSPTDRVVANKEVKRQTFRNRYQFHVQLYHDAICVIQCVVTLDVDIDEMRSKTVSHSLTTVRTLCVFCAQNVH